MENYQKALDWKIRQGCPFSPLIFILVCELLSNKIRQCILIKVIELRCEGGTRMVTFLYFTDDSTLTIQDEKSIGEAFHVENCSIFSGFQLNRNKTVAIWFGCWKFRQRELENIRWTLYPANQINIIGVRVQNNKQIHAIPKKLGIWYYEVQK